jgi:hypothetical protein
MSIIRREIAIKLLEVVATAVIQINTGVVGVKAN